jgi:hypothetical protein
MAGLGPVIDHPDFDVYPYEYVSGVGRLENASWWVDIYMVNRGTTPAKSVVWVLEPGAPTTRDSLEAQVGEITESFRDDITVPPGQVGIAFFGDEEERVAPNYYWVRVVTTSRDLVVSAAFYRRTKGVDETPNFVPAIAYGPADFAVFSPSSPVRRLPPHPPPLGVTGAVLAGAPSESSVAWARRFAWTQGSPVLASAPSSACPDGEQPARRGSGSAFLAPESYHGYEAVQEA